MSVADGESRMACPRGMSSHQSCSTFTLMTSQSTMERVTSYTHICVTAQYSSFREVETNQWRCTGRTHTVLQIQQSACKP